MFRISFNPDGKAITFHTESYVMNGVMIEFIDRKGTFKAVPAQFCEITKEAE
jgi:hypothetical protein